MSFGVGFSCHILYFIFSYLCVSCSGFITSVGEERELICLLLFTCNYVVSARRGFPWVLGMGFVIVLRHSLGLPYTFLLCNQR